MPHTRKGEGIPILVQGGDREAISVAQGLTGMDQGIEEGYKGEAGREDRGTERGKWKRKQGII